MQVRVHPRKSAVSFFFAICHLPFAICHLAFAVWHLPFSIRHWLAGFAGSNCRNGYQGRVTSGLEVLGRFGSSSQVIQSKSILTEVTVVTAPLKQEQQSFCWSIGIEMRDDSGHPVAR